MLRVLLGVAGVIVSATAFADGAAANPNPIGQWAMMGAFGAIFYFLIWRPQSKRAKSHQTLITSLQKDDEIVTGGGILGRVVSVGDNFVTIVVGNGIEMHVQKQAIAMAMPRGTLHAVEAA